ncbi:hypothetical protein ES708_21529 [subsurface metagenome]
MTRGHTPGYSGIMLGYQAEITHLTKPNPFTDNTRASGRTGLASRSLSRGSLHPGCPSNTEKASLISTHIHPATGCGSPSEGVDGLTVPGYTGAKGSDCSPAPSGGELRSAPATVLDRPETPSEQTFTTEITHYLEPVAKPQTFETKIASELFVKKCGLFAKIGQDEDGNRVAKRVDCGRQWCNLCREATQNRRLARLLPRAMQMLPMQYWIIRPPYELMPLLRTKKQRSNFVRKVKKSFKAVGYHRGLTFVHYFGEKSQKFAFHLNILVDGGYLEPEILSLLKQKLRRLIYPQRVIERWGDKLDIWGSYRDTRPKILHTLRYCTKATFLDWRWDEQLAHSIHRERVVGWWGNWKQNPKWQLPKSEQKLKALASLEQKLHPYSGKPITWSKRLVPLVLVLMENPTEIGSGYYFLPRIRPPPGQPAAIKETLDNLEQQHRSAVQLAHQRARESEQSEAAEYQEWLDQLARSGDFERESRI